MHSCIKCLFGGLSDWIHKPLKRTCMCSTVGTDWKDANNSHTLNFDNLRNPLCRTVLQLNAIVWRKTDLLVQTNVTLFPVWASDVLWRWVMVCLIFFSCDGPSPLQWGLANELSTPRSLWSCSRNPTTPRPLVVSGTLIILMLDLPLWFCRVQYLLKLHFELLNSFNTGQRFLYGRRLLADVFRQVIFNEWIYEWLFVDWPCAVLAGLAQSYQLPQFILVEAGTLDLAFYAWGLPCNRGPGEFGSRW